MNIIKEHTLGAVEAKKRIDSFLSELMEKEPSGVKIKDPQKTWDGSIMTFSFKVKKGLISARIEGMVEVEDKRVMLSARPSSSIINAIIDEDKIKEMIESKADALLI